MYMYMYTYASNVYTYQSWCFMSVFNLGGHFLSSFRTYMYIHVYNYGAIYLSQYYLNVLMLYHVYCAWLSTFSASNIVFFSLVHQIWAYPSTSCIFHSHEGSDTLCIFHIPWYFEILLHVHVCFSTM